MFFIEKPKIRQRWPILPKENSYFLQGRPPRNSHLFVYLFIYLDLKWARAARKFLHMLFIIKPKIRERWPILPNENSYFL